MTTAQRNDGDLMQAFGFRGIYPPLITPLDQRGDVDGKSLRRLVRRLVDANVHGIWVLGATGQFHTLTEAQRDEVVQIVIEEVAGAVPVLVGCIDSGPRRSAERARKAHAAGATGVFATAPIYDGVTQVEVANYFRHLHSETPLPVVAYDAEYATHTPLALETVCELAEEGTLVGLKQSADPTVMRHIIAGTDHLPGFSVLTGHTYQVDTGMLSGATGGVPTMANLAPDLYVGIYEAARAGHWAEAARRQAMAMQLEELVRAWNPLGSVFGNFLGAAKAALAEQGVIESSTPGLPYPDGSEEQLARVSDVVKRLGHLMSAEWGSGDSGSQAISR